MAGETITITKEEFEALKSQLGETKSELSQAHSDLSRLNSAIDLLKEKYDAVNEDLKVTSKSLTAKLAYIEKLQRMIFGKRSEKIDPRQLMLFLEKSFQPELSEPGFAQDVLDTPDDESPASTKNPKKKRGKRKKPSLAESKNLPRKSIELNPSAAELLCKCCLSTKTQFGKPELSSKLTYIPGQYVILDYSRPKYTCQKCRSQAVTSAAMPAQVTPKSVVTNDFLAHLISDKYGYHLPLDRIRRRLLEHNIEFGTDTVSRWILNTQPVFERLANAIELEISGHFQNQIDETSMRVRDLSHPKNIRPGHLWFRGGAVGSVRVRATSNKSGKWPRKFLGGYKGYVQADAAQSFDQLYGTDRIEVGCWAHCRRHFEASAKAGDQVCAWMLLGIGELYKIEREAKRDGGDLREVRDKKSRPLVDMMFEWLKEIELIMVKSDPFYEGARYALNQEQALRRFLEDERLELDNTRIERLAKSVAIGRKNWLFAGSPKGAECMAAIYSVVLSAQELKLPLFEYLRDVLNKVPELPLSEVKSMTPLAWLARRETEN